MKANTKAKTLADWRANNIEEVVIENKIRARFATMLKVGSEEHDTESDFCKAADISTASTKIAPFREKFKVHIVVSKVDGKTYWFADPKVALKARGKPA